MRMLRTLIVLALALIMAFAVQALAQTAGVPVTAAPASPGLIAWLQTNWPTVVAPLFVAVIDFVWALSPATSTNGILHALWTFCGGKTPAQPPASS